MREVLIQINGLVCEAQLCDSRRNVLAEARVELSGPTNWYELLAKVGDELNLVQHPPPGLVTEGDVPEKLGAWQAANFGASFTVHGWAWGFWLPSLDAGSSILDAGSSIKQPATSNETCCGFRDEAAAVKAAKFLRHNLDVITGDLPNGVFEIFGLTGTWAFLDLHGEVHASFPTRDEARGCAAKLEAVQMQNLKPET